MVHEKMGMSAIAIASTAFRSSLNLIMTKQAIFARGCFWVRNGMGPISPQEYFDFLSSSLRKSSRARGCRQFEETKTVLQPEQRL
jgi:hypothetical protein